MTSGCIGGVTSHLWVGTKGGMISSDSAKDVVGASDSCARTTGLLRLRRGWRSFLLGVVRGRGEAPRYLVIAGACRGRDDSGKGCSAMLASRRRTSPLRNTDAGGFGFSALDLGRGSPQPEDVMRRRTGRRWGSGAGLASCLVRAMVHTVIAFAAAFSGICAFGATNKPYQENSPSAQNDLMFRFISTFRLTTRTRLTTLTVTTSPPTISSFQALSPSHTPTSRELSRAYITFMRN